MQQDKISDLPEKTTPVSGDLIEIESPSDSSSKHVALENLPKAFPANSASGTVITDNTLKVAKVEAEAWQTWTPVLVGWSGTPTVVAKYQKIGRTYHCIIDIDGTSNNATTTITLPATSANNVRVFSNNNNGSTERIGVALVAAGSNVLTSRLGQVGTTGEVWTNWTNSGTKIIRGLLITFEATA